MVGRKDPRHEGNPRLLPRRGDYAPGVRSAPRRAAIEETFQTLRHVMGQLQGCMRATFAEEGMSFGQMVLLRVLVHKGRATPKELAQALSVTTGNITGLVDKLEAAVLVSRTRSEEDRRVVFIELTAKARQRFRKVHRAAVDMLSEAFEGWTQPQIRQLQDLLERLSSNRPRAVVPPRRRAPLRH